MEYLAARQTQTASMATRSAIKKPHGLGGPSPSGGAAAALYLSALQPSAAAGDSYPAPSPCRRSLTTTPWRPGIYYSTCSPRSLPGSDLVASGGPQSKENRCSSADDMQIPALFAGNRNALYTRYTPSDWKRCQAVEAAACDRARRVGESLRLDAHRLADELEDKQKATRRHIDQLLACRLGDIQFWKNEINHEIDGMIQSIDALGNAKKELERFLNESENLLHIARECLYQREKRHSVDLVHDGPEEELLKEVDMVKQAQIALRTLLERVVAQLELNRATQHDCEKDVKAKHMAAVIDSSALGTKETSRGIALHDGVERVDNCQSVPETWADFANGIVNRSRAQRSATRDLLKDVQCLLNGWAERIRKQWEAVNTALSFRVREVREARDKVQNRLSAVLQDVTNMERDIEFLKKAIQDKRNPMKVAHTRLEMRLHRLGVEACRDSAQYRLVQETHELEESLTALSARSRQCESSLQALLRSRSSLEEDLSTKNYSLFVDQEKCLGMRKTYPVSEKVYSLT